ncbi:hypothetical protein AVEN_12706-1 [Araneus ventricosus]|uniref:Uncharacterized protein n=1 Tax=Araneus ventricosus TaxID=182803 RepID=A0A4Y2ABT0_ARAVE|nr:hypothetical protein AVEN_12706-1 [Araneus ventricosus]
MMTDVKITAKQDGVLTTKLLSLCLSALRLSMPLRKCDASETIKTRGAAQTLFPAMYDFSFLCLWNNALKEVNHIQKYLQIPGISFKKSVIKMRSIKVFLKDKRNNLIEEALKCSKDACEQMGVPVVKRTVRKKKILPGEKAADEPLTLDQELKGSILECIDCKEKFGNSGSVHFFYSKNI